MRALARHLATAAALLLAVLPAAAQSERVTGEARRFLVYPLKILIDFREQPNGEFSLSYQSQPAMPCYYFNVNAVRHADEKSAVDMCRQLIGWHRSQGYSVRTVDGYPCAVVADKRNEIGANACMKGPKGVTQLRTTAYVAGAYFGELAEVSTPPKETPAPTGPLLAALGAGAPAEDDTIAARCPPPKTAEALGKAAAVDTEDALAFLRRQLAVKSDAERICFNSAIRRFPEVVEGVTPSLYDAWAANAGYRAARDARRQWFGEQKTVEQPQTGGGTEIKAYDIETLHVAGTIAVGVAAAPAALVAAAVGGYRLALINVREQMVIPAFHEGLYQRYRTLRAQHDAAEAFDMASQPGSAYHLLVQEMAPVAGAAKMSGEERSQVIARFWRARLELRYQTDQVLAKGPPNDQINAALAPARRCIGGLRAEVTKCVQEAEKVLYGGTPKQ